MAETRRVEVIVDVKVGKVDVSGADTVGEIKPKAGAGGKGPLKDMTLLLPKFIGGLQHLMKRLTAVSRLLKLAFTNPYILAGLATLAGTALAFGANLWALTTAAKAAHRILVMVFQGVVSLAKSALEAVVDLTRRGIQRMTEALASAVETYADFEQQVANTVTVLGAFGDASNAMREVIGQAARDISLFSRKTASEIVRAGYHIASAGFNAIQTMQALPGAVMLAEATLSDLSLAAETVVATINQFGLATTETTTIVNLFAAAISKSPATLEKLRSALEYAGPVAASFQITIEETTAALMAMFKAGRVGSRAGTELRNVMNSMAKQTKKSVDMLAEFGIAMEELSPARIGLINIIERFEQLRDVIGQARFAELLQRAFTMRAASGLAALVMIGSKEMRRMQAAITGTNTAFQMQADQIRTLSGILDILKSDLVEISLTIMGPINEGLRLFFTHVHKLIVELRKRGVFSDFAEALGGITKVLDDAGERLAALAGVYLPRFFAVFGRAAQVTISYLGSRLPTIFLNLERLVYALQSVFEAMVSPKVITALVKAADAFAEMVTSMSEEAMARFIEGLPKLVDSMVALADLLPTVTTRLDELFTRGLQMADRFERALPAALRLATSWLQTFGEMALSGAASVHAIARVLTVALWPALNSLVGITEILLAMAWGMAKSLELNVLWINYLVQMGHKLGLVSKGIADFSQGAVETISTMRKGIETQMFALFDVLRAYNLVLGTLWSADVPWDQMGKDLKRLTSEAEALAQAMERARQPARGKGPEDRPRVPTAPSATAAGRQAGYAASITLNVNDLAVVGRVAQEVVNQNVRRQERDVRVRGLA